MRFLDIIISRLVICGFSQKKTFKRKNTALRFYRKEVNTLLTVRSKLQIKTKFMIYYVLNDPEYYIGVKIFVIK